MNLDLNTVLKWMGTVTLILGTAVNSLGLYPAGPVILLVGGIFWLIVSIRWREPALIVTNLVMFLTAAVGLTWAWLS
jgi:hypothetical protein